MKYLLPLLLLLAWLKAPAQFNLNNNLLAYYPLNGDFNDYSGNGMHAKQHGGVAFTTDAHGNANYSALLDGIDDWIELPFKDLPKGSFTILIKFKTDTVTSGAKYLINIPSNFSGSGSSFSNSISKNLSNPTYLGQRTVLRNACVPMVSLHDNPPISITPGHWYCVASGFSRDTNYTRIIAYSVGGSQTFHTGLVDTCGLDSVLIGTLHLGTASTFFKGVVDEIRIYNQVIFPLHIAAPALQTYCGTLPMHITTNDTIICNGQTMTVSYGGGYLFSGNTLTVQLSDSSGSFSAPVTIGTVNNSTVTPGTVNCMLPVNIIPGTGYRIRIVATNMVGISAPNDKNIKIRTGPSVSAVGTTSVCPGDTVFLAANATSGSTFSWTGPSFSSGQANTFITNITVSGSGNYIVTSTLNGCTEKDTVAVVVKQQPTPVATNSTPLCTSGSVTLSANATAGSSYSWMGPLSFTSSAQNPVISNLTTAHAGNYIVTATLNGCSGKDTVAIAVNTTPAPPTASNSGPLCPDDVLALTASGAAGGSYSWTGPSYSANVQNPVISNIKSANAGVYSAMVTLNGCTSAADTTNVVVKQAPSKPIAGSNTPVCEGATLNLTSGNAGAGSSYSWTGPSAYTSIQQNPSVTNITSSQAGQYVVTATLNGCITKDTTTVLTLPTPHTPSASNSGPVCAGSTLNLSATSSTPGVTYNWTGPAGFTSTMQNPTLSATTVAMNGTYGVTATHNGCTSVAGTTNAIVNLIPATPSAASNSPVCAGGVINLTGSSTTPSVSYNWTGPNNFASAAQNPSISPAPLNGGGTYSVTAELNGCTSASGSTNVVVNNVSSLGVYPSPNDTLCINNANANFTAVPFNAGTAPQYQWYKNNNLIGGATSISYPASGIADGDSFYCRMTVTGLCADPLILYSNKVGMTVLPLTAGPSISITADPGTLLSPWQLVKFTAVATNAGTLPKYQWKRNGQDVIGATSNVWSANNLSNGDTISCIVTSDVWCASPASEMSNRMVVNIKTGISDIDRDGKLELYPNPNNGSFTLNIPLAPFKGGNLRVDVVDALGRTVYSESRSVPTSKFEIALPASVANGAYLLKLTTNDGVQTIPFTVSR